MAPHSIPSPPGNLTCPLSSADNNECLAQPSPCGTRGRCLNAPGSFHCECYQGFTLDSSGHGCKGRAGYRAGGCGPESHQLSPLSLALCVSDVDECDEPHRCRHGCQNEVGGYRCSCPQGFTQHSQWAQCVGEWPGWGGKPGNSKQQGSISLPDVVTSRTVQNS